MQGMACCWQGACCSTCELACWVLPLCERTQGVAVAEQTLQHVHRPTSIVDVRLCAGAAVWVVAERVVCTKALTQALTDVAAFFPAPLCGAVYPFLLLWVGLSSKVLTCGGGVTGQD